jgi:hypothetical protein
MQFFKKICNLKPYNLAGFEPGIFYSGGGRDDHNVTPTEVSF